MSANNKSPLLEKGDVLNEKWEILEHIATGGMAEVYRARQITLDREVAVKVLSREFLDSFEGNEQEIKVAVERFDREVKAMAQVRHPNVLQVFDHDRTVIRKNDKELSIEYISMEYIPGPSLRSTLPPEGMQTNEKGIRRWILNYFLPILDGIETVHRMGIIHRDLKPENVLLDGSTPKITDFGLAGGQRWKPVTQSHHVAGTAPYQAYEQFIDMGETDVRADIYSLGKILYELATGRMAKKQAFFWKTARLPHPDTPFLRRLDRIIQQATAEDKHERTPSINRLREAIVELLEEEEKPGTRVGRVFSRGSPMRKAILPLAALLIIGGVFLVLYTHVYRERTSPPPFSTESPLSEYSPPFEPGSAEGTGIPLSPLASALLGEDGATLRLIPGGEEVLPKRFASRAGAYVKIAPFYMDETEVTNHQYAEFLNRAISMVRVERSVVKGDGNVWLLLGEVTKGYEPIIFRQGRFFVKDPALHSHPVVRVTAYGASAYARFYGRRLPTELEWLYAEQKREDRSGMPSSFPPGNTSEMTEMETMHRQMLSSSPDQKAPSKIPRPVVSFSPNVYGIRGLAENVGEWGLRLVGSAQNEEEGPQYVVLPSTIPRQPWEAFEQVGFRTVLSIPSQEG